MTPKLVKYMLICAPFLHGCESSSRPDSSDVVFITEEEYNKKTAKMKFSLVEAAEIALDAGDGYLGTHYMIIGDDYVFSVQKKDGISRNGCYVNGFTGQSRFAYDQGGMPFYKEWNDILENNPRDEIVKLMHPLTDVDSN